MCNNINNRMKYLVQFLTIFSSVFLMQVHPSLSAETIYFDLVIDESRELLYGTDRVGGCIDIISMNTLQIVNTITLGSLSYPSGLDISPDSKELAIALTGKSEIALIDLETFEVSGSLVPTVTVGISLPYDVIYGRPGRLYSVGYPGSGGFDYVHAFDTINKTELGKSSTIVRYAPRLAKTGDNNTLYVSDVPSPAKIYRFDISTDTPVQTAAAPHGPVNVKTLAVKPDASRIYSSRGQIWSIYLTTQLGSFSPSGDEIEYSDTLQRFFVTSGSTVYEFDANTYNLVKLHKLSSTGGVARVNDSGTSLYVSTDLGIKYRSLNHNCYYDNDKDGYGTSVLISENGDGICKAVDNESDFNTDCNDNNPNINPSVSEIPADLVDQNCDGIEDCYEDNDFDLYGSPVVMTGNDLDCTDTYESYVKTDCNDGNNSIHPWAFETWYDGIDSNCDDANDYDADKDTYVSSSYNAQAGGSAPNTDDCNDSNPSIHPGAIEIPADLVDQNCDGKEYCYEDSDLDYYGSAFKILSDDFDCTDSFESLINTDCNDHDISIHPGASETWYDGIDNNCDAANDYDADGDAFVSSSYNAHAGGTAPNTGDCDDGNNLIHPGVPETWYDGIDSNCDGANDYDADKDTYVSSNYNAQTGGTAPNTGDCNDGNNSIHPGASETWYDGIDSNCDGANDYDADGDAFVSSSYNAHAGGTAPNTGDCDDSNNSIHPGVPEIWYDGIDRNCDGANDYDADKDGYVSSNYNAQAGATAPYNGDCNDGDHSIHPGVIEIWYDGVDSNCDSANDYDADGDTYVSSSYNSQAGGTAPNTDDCDDENDSINPGTLEICDKLDNNCDSQIDENKVCKTNIFQLVLPAIINQVK